jgi:hypothetical protein
MRELKKQGKKKTVFKTLNAKAFFEGYSGYIDSYSKTGGCDKHDKGTDLDDFSNVLF